MTDWIVVTIFTTIVAVLVIILWIVTTYESQAVFRKSVPKIKQVDMTCRRCNAHITHLNHAGFDEDGYEYKYPYEFRCQCGNLILEG